MAYKIAEFVQPSDGNSTSETVDVPLGHASGDLMLFVVTQSSGTGTITAPGGFTQVTTQANESSQRTAVYYAFAASSSESAKTFSSTLNAPMTVHASVWRGVDATTPIDNSVRFSTGVTSRTQFASLTTTSNNCTLVYIGGWGGIGSQGRLIAENPDDMVMLTKQHNTCNQIVGYKNQYTAGSAPQPYVRVERTTNGGSLITVALKDDGNGKMSPDNTQTYTPIIKGGLWTTIHEYADASWVALSTMAATSVAGIPVSSAVATVVNNVYFDSADPYGFMTGLQYAVSGVDATGIWIGGVYAPGSAIDMSTKLFSVNVQLDAVSSLNQGTQGLVLIFQDSSSNWAAIQVSQRQGLSAGVNYVFVCDLTTATPLDSSGTMDWSSVAKIGYGYHRVTTAVSTRRHSLSNMILIDKAVITGGNSSSPLKPTFLQDAIHGWTANRLTILQGSGQMLAKIPAQIGNGTAKTYYKASATSVELPSTYDASLTNRFWKVGQQRTDVTIYASSADTIDYASCVTVTKTKQNFTIHASSSTSATYNFAGAVFSGWVVTGRSGITFNSTTFDGNYKITLNGGGLTKSLIEYSLDTIAVTTTDPSEIVDCIFISNGTGHAIEITTPGTYDFTGNSFTGYGADTTTDASIYNNSGGVVELVIPLSDDTPTVRNGTGASTTITQPTDNQSVTISGAVSGSRIQIYDLTSSTELYNGTPTFPYTWTDSSAYVADRQIRLRVSKVASATAKQFIETIIGTSTSTVPALAYLVSQTDDTVYNTNAVDGSTITTVTIDDSSLLIEVDTGTISIKDIYAYEMYWLNTSVGIADEGKAVVATDVANYAVYGFKFKNVTSPSVPLTITGGWVTDGDTGVAIDIVDTTGGTIFLAPDHVVAYATSSGVTAGDKTDIIEGVWDELKSAHTVAGSFGKSLADTEDSAELASFK